MSDGPFFGLDRTAEAVRFTKPSCPYATQQTLFDETGAIIGYRTSYCTLLEHEGEHSLTDVFAMK